MVALVHLKAWEMGRMAMLMLTLHGMTQRSTAQHGGDLGERRAGQAHGNKCHPGTRSFASAEEGNKQTQRSNSAAPHLSMLHSIKALQAGRKRGPAPSAQLSSGQAEWPAQRSAAAPLGASATRRLD